MKPSNLNLNDDPLLTLNVDHELLLIFDLRHLDLIFDSRQTFDDLSPFNVSLECQEMSDLNATQPSSMPPR